METSQKSDEGGDEGGETPQNKTNYIFCNFNMQLCRCKRKLWYLSKDEARGCGAAVRSLQSTPPGVCTSVYLKCTKKKKETQQIETFHRETI